MENVKKLVESEFPAAKRIRASKDFIEAVALSPSEKVFLTDVGCPVVDELCVRLDMLSQRAKRLSECGVTIVGESTLDGRVCLGVSDNNAAFALDENDNGSVWCIELEKPDRAVFVNTGLLEFSSFLALYWGYCREYNIALDAARRTGEKWCYSHNYKTFVDTLKLVDEPALEHGCWWDWILLDMQAESGS